MFRQQKQFMTGYSSTQLTLTTVLLKK